MRTIKVSIYFLLITFFLLSGFSLFLTFSDISPWIRSIFILPTIILIPGSLLSLLVKLNTEKKLEHFLYLIGIGITYWILGGLLINWLLPFIGILEPLSLYPIIVFYIVSLCIFSLLIIVKRPRKVFILNLNIPNRRDILIFSIPVLILIMSILGTVVLNNFGGGYFTIGMIFLIGFFVLFIVLFKKLVNPNIYPWTIYFISLSLLFMYSLRSWHIIGWDIHQELSVFQMTLLHNRWSMNFFPHEAYNACLSITILPTILQKFSNIPGEYIFKVLYNILFAFVPVGIYFLVNNYLRRRESFLAAFFFISQIWFYEQLPALTRQEIGLFYYILIIMLILNKSMHRGLRLGLFYFFSFGLIVSHYSTAYIWLVQMGLVIFVSILFKLFKFKAFQINHLKPSMFLISLILLLIWEVAITQSYSSSYSVFKNSENHLLDSFIPSKLENSVVTAIYGRPNVNTTENIRKMIVEANLRSENYKLKLYPKYTYRDYIPISIDDRKKVNSKLPVAMSKFVLTISKICKAFSSYIFLFFGFLALLILHFRKKTRSNNDLILLTLSGFSLVILMLLLPNLQANYNFSRLYMQSLVLACICPIIGASIMLMFIPKYKYLILSTILVISFIFTTGVVEQISGGFERITLNQPNGTFDTFYVYDQEIRSAKWLSKNHVINDPIFADVLAGMRLSTYANLKSNPDIFPSSISKDGYVYLSNANAIRNHGFVKFDNNTIVFNYPTHFLIKEKNLIYNNGGSKIYK